MVYLNIRHTVTDYEKWRPFFDEDEARRRAAGATGVNQVYRDVHDANTVTVVIEWDNAENARKFMDDPALREVMQKAGVIGMPTVRAVQSRA
jgi:heme-degrading monooxygenase HmoA